jgi:hypothetical protein
MPTKKIRRNVNTFLKVNFESPPTFRQKNPSREADTYKKWKKGTLVRFLKSMQPKET